SSSNDLKAKRKPPAVKKPLPPRHASGAFSSTSTRAPCSCADSAAHIAALPPPTTMTSYERESLMTRAPLARGLGLDARRLECPDRRLAPATMPAIITWADGRGNTCGVPGLAHWAPLLD